MLNRLNFSKLVFMSTLVFTYSNASNSHILHDQGVPYITLVFTYSNASNSHILHDQGVPYIIKLIVT